MHVHKRFLSYNAKKKYIVLLLIANGISLVVLVYHFASTAQEKNTKELDTTIATQDATTSIEPTISPIEQPTPTITPFPSPTAKPVQSSASYAFNFSVDKVYEETGSMASSPDPNWWVSSGGSMIASAGTGKTFQGEINDENRWKRIYADSNSNDTDEGKHPQNIFRLVQKSQWQNYDQEVYFKVNADNLSSSENRNASNGVLLFNRYQDANTLYYAGIRVDGAAVVKKKMQGEYTTLAYVPVLSGSYEKDSNANLLPKNTWIGLKSSITNKENNTVLVTLSLDLSGNGEWKRVITVVDDGRSSGRAITESGHAGIRTDFMDVEFDRYSITKSD